MVAGSEGLRLGCLGAGRGAAALPMLVPSWIYTLRALPHGSSALGLEANCPVQS